MAFCLSLFAAFVADSNMVRKVYARAFTRPGGSAPGSAVSMGFIEMNKSIDTIAKAYDATPVFVVDEIYDNGCPEDYKCDTIYVFRNEADADKAIEHLESEEDNPDVTYATRRLHMF